MVWNPVTVILEGEWTPSILDLCLIGWASMRLFGVLIRTVCERRTKSYGVLALIASYWSIVGFF